MKTYSGFLGSVPLMQHALAREVHWDTRLSIGYPAIDVQDRVIFGLVAEIDELWRRGADVAQLRSLADRTSRVLEAHFRSEERMLAEVHYPDLPRHAAEHREMLEDLASIRAYLAADGGRHSDHAALRLANFMLGVTMGHVTNTDGDYCKYLADELATAPTGCA
jgi:hemerythrin-like metal-binding protein